MLIKFWHSISNNINLFYGHGAQFALLMFSSLFFAKPLRYSFKNIVIDDYYLTKILEKYKGNYKSKYPLLKMTQILEMLKKNQN